MFVGPPNSHAVNIFQRSSCPAYKDEYHRGVYVLHLYAAHFITAMQETMQILIVLFFSYRHNQVWTPDKLFSAIIQCRYIDQLPMRVQAWKAKFVPDDSLFELNSTEIQYADTAWSPPRNFAVTNKVILFSLLHVTLEIGDSGLQKILTSYTMPINLPGRFVNTNFDRLQLPDPRDTSRAHAENMVHNAVPIYSSG
jgi:hypothetical protein